ncbi:MAG: glucosaminidase domain-containing protein [Alphaproteobacteria bacterium]
MRGIIRNFRKHKRTAFTVSAVAAALLYGAVAGFSVDQPARASLDWVALPQVDFAFTRPQFADIDDDMVEVASAATLHNVLDETGFALRQVRRGDSRVPRLLVESLPADFDQQMVVEARKKTFIRTVLPLILKANEEVRQERRRLIDLEEQILSGHELSDEDQNWLDRLAEKYDAAPGDFAALLRRVDTVSPTLALAQAIEESGWGRSRFARDGNALYGQRAWSEGAGFVPEERADGERFEVRAFESLLDSVRSYVLNLNRHYAYEDYRVVRAQMRARDTQLDAHELAQTLVSYSERREAYVDALLGLIRTNRLDDFEVAQLSTEPFDLEGIESR